MQNALSLALDQAVASGGSRIHQLRLRVGELSGVVPDALQFAFDVVCRGTMAEGARLEIESVPTAGWCPACEQEFDCANFSYECPNCHRLTSELRRGRELELTSVEIS